MASYNYIDLLTLRDKLDKYISFNGTRFTNDKKYAFGSYQMDKDRLKEAFRYKKFIDNTLSLNYYINNTNFNNYILLSSGTTFGILQKAELLTINY
jgi:hypothetical protein